jgi:hypothetical protein
MGTPGWTAISAEDYQIYFERFGGSFHVHPRVVTLVEKLSGRPVEYKAYFESGEPKAAVPLWGHFVVATNRALDAYGCRGLLDVGTTEVILPVAETTHIHAPFVAEQLSALHADNFINQKLEPLKATLAKGLLTGEIRRSAKSIRRINLGRREFHSAGGEARSVSNFTPGEMVDIYRDLHIKRWGGPPFGDAHLKIAFGEFHDLLAGHVLLIDGHPVAVQIIYKTETPRWMLANYVNGGVDREKGHSLGALLNLLNLSALEDEALAKGKPLRASFGKSDADYKALWCYEIPSYRLDLPPLHPAILSRRIAGLNRRIGRRLDRLRAGLARS